MTDLSKLFRDERFDVTDSYTQTNQEFDKLTFAREILTLVMQDYDALANLMRVENAPLFTQNDEMVGSDEVLGVEVVNVDGVDKIAVVTLKQKNENGENKKFIVSGDMTPQAFADYSAMPGSPEGAGDDESVEAKRLDEHAAVRTGGYEQINSLSDYEDTIASEDRITVFGPVGEFGEGLIRFHQLDDSGKVVYRGFIDAKMTPDAFEQVKADQAYFADHGSLEVA